MSAQTMTVGESRVVTLGNLLARKAKRDTDEQLRNVLREEKARSREYLETCAGLQEKVPHSNLSKESSQNLTVTSTPRRPAQVRELAAKLQDAEARGRDLEAITAELSAARFQNSVLSEQLMEQRLSLAQAVAALPPPSDEPLIAVSVPPTCFTGGLGLILSTPQAVPLALEAPQTTAQASAADAPQAPQADAKPAGAFWTLASYGVYLAAGVLLLLAVVGLAFVSLAVTFRALAALGPARGNRRVIY